MPFSIKNETRKKVIVNKISNEVINYYLLFPKKGNPHFKMRDGQHYEHTCFFVKFVIKIESKTFVDYLSNYIKFLKVFHQ